MRSKGRGEIGGKGPTSDRKKREDSEERPEELRRKG